MSLSQFLTRLADRISGVRPSRSRRRLKQGTLSLEHLEARMLLAANITAGVQFSTDGTTFSDDLSVAPGDDVWVRVNYDNTGDIAASSAQAGLTLPAGVSLIADSTRTALTPTSSEIVTNEDSGQSGPIDESAVWSGSTLTISPQAGLYAQPGDAASGVLEIGKLRYINLHDGHYFNGIERFFVTADPDIVGTNVSNTLDAAAAAAGVVGAYGNAGQELRSAELLGQRYLNYHECHYNFLTDHILKDADGTATGTSNTVDAAFNCAGTAGAHILHPDSHVENFDLSGHRYLNLHEGRYISGGDLISVNIGTGVSNTSNTPDASPLSPATFGAYTLNDSDFLALDTLDSTRGAGFVEFKIDTSVASGDLDFMALISDLSGNGEFANQSDTGTLSVSPPTPDSFVVTIRDDENDGSADPGMGDGTSLREAIIAANANPNPSTITFAPATNTDPQLQDWIELGIDGAGEDGSLTGDLDITSPITIVGNGRETTTISAQGISDRVFHIGVGGSLQLREVTTRGGASSMDGANVLVAAGTLDVTDSDIFSGSTLGGYSGGGIFVESGTDVTITRSRVTGNNSVSGSGGGIYVNSNAALSLVDSDMQANYADDGGAIHARPGANVLISGSTIRDNRANQDGGGIDNSDANVRIENSTISGNIAERRGGGIVAPSDGGSLTIVNSTITGNLVSPDHDGAGGIHILGATSAPPVLHNTIVAGNATFMEGIYGQKLPDQPSDMGPGSVTLTSSHNLIGDPASSGGLTHGTSGNIVGKDDGASGRMLLPISEILDTALVDNGGPTATHYLVSGSPALDAGDNTQAVDADSSPLADDQRGASRIQFSTVDIGAVEVQPPDSIVVTIAEDEADGDMSPADISLREAVLFANRVANETTITFAPELNGVPLTLTIPETHQSDPVGTADDGDLVVKFSTEIQGNGSSETIIQGGTLADLSDSISGLFRFSRGQSSISGTTLTNAKGIYGAVSTTASLTISDSLITNNSSEGGQYGAYPGGGIHVSSGRGPNAGPQPQVTITGTTISNNEGQFGAGIVNFGGHVEVRNSTITGNVALGDGGGIYSQGPRQGRSEFTLIVADSTISDNTATYGNGGGIVAHDEHVEIDNSTISGNTAGRDGGAIFTRVRGGGGPTSTVLIEGSTISGNMADRDGGGIANDGDHVELRNSTLSGNSAGRSGGGVFTQPYIEEETFVSANSTIVGNTSDSGGGGIHNNGDTVRLYNTIVAGNISGPEAGDIGGDPVDPGSSNNLIGDSDSAGGLVDGGPENNIVGLGGSGVRPLAEIIDPTLADNGGPTATHMLVTGSAAIDAGNDYLALDDMMNMLITDQRGTGFDRILNSAVDIGAIEFDAPPEPQESTIVDDSDPQYSNAGRWTNVGRNGHEGGFQFASAGDGSSISTWTFSLPHGQYRVSATWRQWTNRASNAPFTVRDGAVPLSTVRVNQQHAPSGPQHDGSEFEELGIFEIASGQLTVELSNDADGLVVADAVLVEPIGVIDPGPEISVSVGGAVVQDEDSYDFGNVMQGATATRTFTVDNLGDQDLIVQPITVPTGFTLVGPNFGVDQVIPAGQSASFQLQVDSSTQGNLSGEVTFGHNDADENPFNFTVQAVVGPAVQVIDNSSGAGFATSGSFVTVNRNGHLGNFVYSVANSGGSATFTFNVAAGDYRVSAGWREHTNRTTNAQYVITDTDNATDLATVNVNQRVAPTADVTIPPGGRFNSFQDLGTVTVNGNTLTVTLSNLGNDGLLIADALRIERL